MPPGQATDPPDAEAQAGELDAHVRHADPDRWLAARLVADPAARRSLLALYALNDELARVADSVTQPLLGEMRLAWWREAVEEARQGRPRAHPVLQAIAPVLQSGAVSVGALAEMIDARRLDLEPAPFADTAALTAYLDATAGALMRAAAALLDPRAPPDAVRSAARAWGWAGLLRVEPAWRAGGRRWAPADWGEAVTAEAAAERARAGALAALAAAQVELRALPVPSFPAVAYVRLVHDYARGRAPGEVSKRVQLLWASARGRV